MDILHYQVKKSKRKSKTIKRIFYFKRFVFFMTALCILAATAVIFFSTEKLTVISTKDDSQYVLTLSTTFTKKDDAEKEKATQLLHGNVGLIIQNNNSYYICFEVYSSYSIADKAQKTHKDNGRILSIIFIEQKEKSYKTKKESAQEFLKLYAQITQIKQTLKSLQNQLQAKQISQELAQATLTNLEIDFKNTVTSLKPTQDQGLNAYHQALKALKTELEQSNAYKTQSSKKQCHYLSLIFNLL